MDAATRVPLGIGIPYHLRSDNLFMRYVDDDHIIINDNVVTYDEIKNAHDVFMNPELYDGASTVELAHHDIVLSKYEVKLIMDSLKNIRYEDGTNYVARKEDMTYEELCTLEGMIALFNHDESLDKEISNLKEECLLNTINELESKYNSLESEHTQLLFNEHRSERVMDALTLMFYVKSEKVPADKVDELLNEAIKNPMALLEHIDEADKSKYDVNISKYVEDVEGEW